MLSHRIIPTITFPAHAADHLMGFQHFPETVAAILSPCLSRLSDPDLADGARLPCAEQSNDQLLGHSIAQRTTHNLALKDIQNYVHV